MRCGLGDGVFVEQDAENGAGELLGRVQSLVRAFGVLDALSISNGASLSDIARQVSLPRSTVHRLLTTMEALHFVEFDRHTHLWSVGLKAFTVGAAFVQTRDLGQLGRSIMRSLMTEVHHSVNIAVHEGSGMCYVGQVAATGIRQKTTKPGSCLPMHTTASGKVLMAHWEPEEVERFLDRRVLARRTAQSIVDPIAIREELAVIRKRGYAIDDQEQADGLRCVAAIVLDRYGLPKASLSISDTVARLDHGRIDEIGPTLMLAARQMSREITTQLGF
jgi:IclR family acetate operon transcriptional repressor